jgi:hypothetical protein
MSLYKNADSELMSACSRYFKNEINSGEFTNLCQIHALVIKSLEDVNLGNMLSDIRDKYWSTLWYLEEDRNLSHEEEQKVRNAILPYVDCIEKLIVRGHCGGSSLTDEERAEWWKKQKKHERDEFYKFNGYYEDE